MLNAEERLAIFEVLQMQHRDIVAATKFGVVLASVLNELHPNFQQLWQEHSKLVQSLPASPALEQQTATFLQLIERLKTGKDFQN
jgi:hypothetical protein